MPRYLFTAKSPDGTPRTGEIVSSDEKTVVTQLRNEGFLVTSLQVVSEKDKDKPKIAFLDRFTTIPLKEILFFTRNLSVMTASGLPITRSLTNLAAQTKNKRFQGIIVSLAEDVQKGTSLSESLAKFPSVFDDLFVNMVRVGEVGGTLEESLNILTVQIEKAHSLNSKVRGAMIYPSVIILAMVAVGVIMLTYILPQIMGVFEDMDVELPAMTLFVMGMSSALQNYSVFIIIAVVGGGFGLKMFLRTQTGKRSLSWLVLHLPAIKNMVIKINSARFARIYASLLNSGVSVVDALDIVADTLGNTYYRDAVHEGREKIQKGVELSAIFEDNPNLFPIIMTQMAKVGEETGKTAEMLIKIAEFYEEEINELTKNLSSIIEPVLMLLIGGAVGFFAVAMMQPMYSVLEGIN